MCGGGVILFAGESLLGRGRCEQFHSLGSVDAQQVAHQSEVGVGNGLALLRHNARSHTVQFGSGKRRCQVVRVPVPALGQQQFHAALSNGVVKSLHIALVGIDAHGHSLDGDGIVDNDGSLILDACGGVAGT